MGGKSSTSTQSVSIPPSVLAQYNSVNQKADATANTPFQQYSTDPNAFVAPINAQQNAGIAGVNAAANQAQPYFSQATSTLNDAQAAAQPYYSNATSDVTGAQSVGTGLAGASLGALGSATTAASGLNNAANQNYSAAYANAQPYNAAATTEALAGGQAVNADPITGQQINQYMSPYLQDVLGSESAVLNQNNQQQQAGQLGNAITSGAFGGDRAGIGAANLEQQQNLANANIYSGILNTGYNNALATAQQQQGVNLGASQANRTAAQQTAASLQGLGQQEYSQGTGLASAQQGLGQQEYSQGANTASQLAALGQQQFGQGVTAANTQAGLGQDVYGTGAATSAALANLGTGAQSAAEQGAQAQLAAGTLQQQTTQAGDTALYNQFEQQQSYPFQVDQFLANIAEGTGALSGSTTTTNQPGSLFSDERLKEDVQTIGKTFDGQNIVKFRYKGDNKTQIGLIAQDVEKKHPEAVGLAGGYRTVNYDKATQHAASRGHFAGGGLARAAFAYGGEPGLPGMGAGDLSAILQSQQQMYAPYAGGGLYGGTAGSAPHGGSSYVPQGTLPVSHLAVANGNLPAQPSALDTLDKLSKVADNPLVSKGIGAAQDAVSGWMQGQGGSDAAAPTSDVVSTDSINDMLSNGLWGSGNARGGAIKRAAGGLAEADLPYSGQGGMDIPDSSPTATLPVPGALPKQSDSGLGDIEDIASTIAKFLPHKRGGAVRDHFADGGVTDDLSPDSPTPTDPADAGIHSLLANLLGGNSPDDAAIQSPQVSFANPTTASTPPASVPTGEGSAPGAPVAHALSLAKNAVQTAGLTLANIPGGTLRLIAKAEGTGKNPTSSAQGLYQIIDPTFVGAFKQMFPDRAAGMTKQQILALRSTPEGNDLSAQMGPFLAKQNMAALQQHGFEPSAPNVYLAHFLGPSGAIKVLSADPSTPLSSGLVGPEAIAANKSILAGKTAGDVRQWAANRLQQVASRQGRARGGLAGRGHYDDGGDVSDDPMGTGAPTRDAKGDIVPVPFPPPPSAPGPSDNIAVGDVVPDAPAAPTGLAGGSVDKAFSDSAPAADTGLAGVDDSSAPPSGGLASAGAATTAPAHQSILDDLKKPEVFIPILTGLAAWASAPTRNPLTALAVGAGAGANAYQAQRAYELQQQQLAQHQQEVNIAQQNVNYTPQRLAIERTSAGAGAMQAQTQAASQAMQLFDANYSQIGKIGSDGLPMYRSATGQELTQTEYGNVRKNYLASMLGRFGTGGAGPLGAASSLSGPDTGGGNASPNIPAVPSVPVSGASPGGVGNAQPVGGNGGAGAYAPVGGAGAVVAPGPKPQAGVAPGGSTLKAKLASGAYMGSQQPLPPVDESQIDPSTDPVVLMRDGQALIQNGGSDAMRALGQSKLKMAQDIMSGAQPALDKNGQPYTGYVQRAQAQGVNNAVTASYGDQIKAMNDASTAFATQYPAQQQILNSLTRIYSETNTNRLSEDWADLIGKVSSVPGLSGVVSPAVRQYQDATDEAHKDAARQAIVQAVASNMASHAPAAALAQTNLTVPGPQMGPGARYNLVGQMQALLNLSHDQYSDWAQNKGRVQDVSSYQNDWVSEHPIQKYEQQAYDRIDPFPGMTPQEMAQHPRHPQSPSDLAGKPSGTPFVVPSGPFKGQIRYTP